MRILYHHRTLGDGAEGIHINEMVRAFRALGHEVQVVALVGDQADDTATTPTESPQRRWSAVSRLLPGVAYEVAEIGYNIVGRRAVTRAIREFQPDLIYDRYNSFSTAAVDAGTKAQIPVFLEVNAPVAYERTEYEHRPLRLNRLAQRYEKRICNSASHIFTVSTPLKEFLVTERDVPNSHVTVIPNGVDPAKFNPSRSGDQIKQRLGIDADTVIGFVGILRPWHGLDLLLDAFNTLRAQSSSVHLLIVGDGTIESELKQRVDDLAMNDAVSFTGRVPHSEMNQYLAAMDVAVSPRATFYASPMKILEYMAMGIATVAPNMANIRDIIEDGENGVLFEPENVESLADALTDLIQSPETKKRIGRNARQLIESERNWVRIAQQVVDGAKDFRTG